MFQVKLDTAPTFMDAIVIENRYINSILKLNSLKNKYSFKVVGHKLWPNTSYNEVNMNNMNPWKGINFLSKIYFFNFIEMNLVLASKDIAPEGLWNVRLENSLSEVIDGGTDVQ